MSRPFRVGELVSGSRCASERKKNQENISNGKRRKEIYEASRTEQKEEKDFIQWQKSADQNDEKLWKLKFITNTGIGCFRGRNEGLEQ